MRFSPWDLFSAIYNEPKPNCKYAVSSSRLGYPWLKVIEGFKFRERGKIDKQ
jgi:hypothetical protein